MMKKIMIAAGAFSTFAFLFGSLFKVMHWPGASMFLTSAVIVFSFFFMPLLFILKSKEVNTGLEKTVIALGTLLGIMFCLSILFRVQHWPGATILIFVMIIFSFFVFIPLFFFSGYRKHETRLNTILTSILLIGFTAVTFLSVTVHGPTPKQINDWNSYCQNEMIWEKVALKNHRSGEPATTAVLKNSDDLKNAILALTTTEKPKTLYVLPSHLKVDNLGYLGRDGRYDEIQHLLQNLQASVKKYNQSQLDEGNKIPDGFVFMDASAKDFSQMENIYVLNNLTQLQIYLVSTSPERTALVIH